MTTPKTKRPDEMTTDRPTANAARDTSPLTQLPQSIRNRLKAPPTAPQAPQPETAASDTAMTNTETGADRNGQVRARLASALAEVKGRGVSKLAAARSHLKKADTVGGALRKNAGPVFHGVRAVGLRLGRSLDTLARRIQKTSEVSKPAPPVVATFDTTPRETVTRRPSIFAVGALATAVVTAGLLHLVTTFAIPMLGTGSAYTMLKPALPANRMVVFPPQAPGRQILPFIAPDTIYAVCRYDISANPLVVRTRLAGLGWSLTLHTPAGDNFYAMPGQTQGPTDVTFLLVPPTDRVLAMMPGARREDLKMNQIVAPSREGLIVVRAPIKAAALVEETGREMAASSCKPSEFGTPLN